MLARYEPNLVLAGFMGTGKSTVGPILARMLDRTFVDTDRVIEQDAHLTVSEVFARHGEAAFRALECDVCTQVAESAGLVVAVGGGALLDQRNRAALEATGVLVMLTCRTESLVQRLRESGERGERPLLGGDIGETVSRLLEERAPVYTSVALQVDTTNRTPENVAEAVLALYSDAVQARHRVIHRRDAEYAEILLYNIATHHSPLATRHSPLAPTRLEVRAPDGGYSVLMGRGLLDRLGELASEHGLGRKVVVATDTNVAPLYGEQVMSALRARDFDVSIASMRAGEAHKSWASVSMFVDEFAHVGLARDGWVLALGGGVVGDTAGFAASIYMRGVSLVQVPTTLLAITDSSIGGKVGVDHPAGKNLVGAFKQPEFVVADLDVLATLPPIQISCGMAEIIKAGIIADPDLFSYLEQIEPDELDYVFTVMRAMEVKRRIVEADPLEKGERANLNLGHTFGHAFESCTGYARPHGVAVAQGMVVAFNLAARLSMCGSAEGVRLQKLLIKWGLPCSWGEPDLADEEAAKRVYTAMAADKKRRGGLIRLALPEAIGRVALVSGTPQHLILEALAQTQRERSFEF